MGLSKKERDMLAAAGITLTEDDFVGDKLPIDEEQHTKDMAAHEAQSLLIMCKWPYPEVVAIDCWGCGQRFLTNLPSNVYCSQQCFKDELEKIGLVWNPDKSFMAQWGNLEPPLMVPPAAIKAMRRLLRIVDQETPALSRPRVRPVVEEEPESPLQSHSPKQDSEPVPLEYDFSEDALPDPPTPYNDPDIQSEHDKDLDVDFLALLDAQDD